jgi:hypothetical protein
MNMKWLWIENSDGKKDTMLTFAVAAFVVVLFKVIFGGMDFTIAGGVYKVIPIDATMVGALISPPLTAYVARRYTDRKFVDANNNGVNDEDEKKV